MPEVTAEVVPNSEGPQEATSEQSNSSAPAAGSQPSATSATPRQVFEGQIYMLLSGYGKVLESVGKVPAPPDDIAKLCAGMWGQAAESNGWLDSFDSPTMSLVMATATTGAVYGIPSYHAFFAPEKRAAK